MCLGRGYTVQGAQSPLRDSPLGEQCLREAGSWRRRPHGQCERALCLDFRMSVCGAQRPFGVYFQVLDYILTVVDAK